MRPRIAVAALFAVLAAACGSAVRTPEPTGSASVEVTFPKADASYVKHVTQTASLRRFPDCTAVTKTLRADALRYVGPYGLPGGGRSGVFNGEVALAQDKSAAATSGQAAPIAAAPQAGVDYSTTNVQEQGVDEPDTVETDGRRIFAVSNQTLHAGTISGDTPKLVSALHLQSNDAQLLLEGDRLIVIGGDTPAGGPVEPMGAGMAMSFPASYSEKTLVQIIDVSDPAHMVVESTLHLDGSYVDARAVKGIVRIVVRNSTPNIAFATPSGDAGSPASEQNALARNRDIVSKAGVDKWIPRYTLQTSKGASSGALSSCDSTYAPPTFSGLSTVSVVTVDPAKPAPQKGATIVGGAEKIYASQNALYVTAQKWDEPAPVASHAGPDYPAGKGVVEPQMAPMISPSSAETQIHKFDITGSTANYVASGIVSGTLLNSYAMSELDGVLRVATTTQSYTPTSQSSSSGITAFAQQDKALVPVGHVGGLGAGEQIRGVRFIGTVGYVVTFRQTDPLYTLDLSDAEHPRIAGQLELLGYSAYLHPIGDDLLLGVGQDADELGRRSGLQLSLFDVSDPSQPKRIGHLALSSASSSQAEWDHHAFLYWPRTRLVVLPVESYGADDFAGAIGFRVPRDGAIAEVGRVQTDGFSNVRRSTVVGDRLFTLGYDGFEVSGLDRLDRVGRVDFPGVTPPSPPPSPR